MDAKSLALFYLIAAFAVSSVSARIYYGKPRFAEGMTLEEKIASNANFVEAKDEDYTIYAFELSLYYQGFREDIIGGIDKYDEPCPLRTYNEMPRDEDLMREIKVRDADKALHYAQIAHNMITQIWLSRANLANMYLSGVGTERNVEKAIAALEEPSFPANPSEAYRIDAPMLAYLYYKGIGIERNLERCNAIISKEGTYAWRNFYCGYLVPKDFDFAVYWLERSDEFWAALTLFKIYSGEYLPEHADAEKAKHWKKILDERMTPIIDLHNRYFKASINVAKRDGNLPKLAVFLGAQKMYKSDNFLYKDVVFENPQYDLEACLAVLEELEEKYSSTPEGIEFLAHEITKPIIHRYDFRQVSLRFEGEGIERIKKLAEKYRHLRGEK